MGVMNFIRGKKNINESSPTCSSGYHGENRAIHFLGESFFQNMGVHKSIPQYGCPQIPHKSPRWAAARRYLRAVWSSYHLNSFVCESVFKWSGRSGMKSLYGKWCGKKNSIMVSSFDRPVGAVLYKEHHFCGESLPPRPY